MCLTNPILSIMMNNGIFKGTLHSFYVTLGKNKNSNLVLSPNFWHRSSIIKKFEFKLVPKSHQNRVVLL